MKTPEEIAAEMAADLRKLTTKPFTVKLWRSEATLKWWVAIEAIDNIKGRRVDYVKSKHFEDCATAQSVIAELRKLQP